MYAMSVRTNQKNPWYSSTTDHSQNVVQFHKCHCFLFSHSYFAITYQTQDLLGNIFWGSENLSSSNFVLPHADNQCSQGIGKTEQNVQSITKICNIENKLQLHCWFEPELLKVCPSIFCMCVRSLLTALCMNKVSILCTDILCLHYINGGRNVFFFLLVAGMP